MNGMSRNKAPATADTGRFPRFFEAIRAVHAHGIIVVDPDGQITTLTPEAARLLGINTPAGAQANLESLPLPVRETIVQVNASKKPIIDIYLRLASAEQPSATIKVSAYPLPCHSDQGAILVVDDVEAARKLEHHLQRLDRLADIGTLSASMAHEIKNALVAGRTFIELLLEKHSELELTSVVKRELGRIDAIVSRMLKYAGNHERQFQHLHVHEMLDHSLRLVKPQLDSKSILLDRSFRAAADLVDGNENELQQAIVNLFLNALEAMVPGGTLSISTRVASAALVGHDVRSASPSTPEQIEVLIGDTGHGIEPEKLTRVFTPFFTTKPEGTGLGLAITQRIVHEHSGEITVESEMQRGTRFCIALPLVDNAQARH